MIKSINEVVKKMIEYVIGAGVIALAPALAHFPSLL